MLLAARDKHLAYAALVPVAAPEPEPEAAPTTLAPPGEYTYPISCELMVDPAGRHRHRPELYERECIVNWLRTKQTDPSSNAKLPNKKLVPNFALWGAIVQWKETHPECTGHGGNERPARN